MLVRIVVALLALGLLGAAAFADDSGQTIRVGLAYGGDAPQSVVISGPGEWRAGRSQGTFDGDARVSAGRRDLELQVGDRTDSIAGWIEIRPADSESLLELDGSTYRGSFRIERQRDGRLRVINTVGLEDYVRGVVPNEMFPHPEAFKVQAVIARTYGVYVRDLERKHQRDGFDICSTGHCQVYGGRDSERDTSDRAVALTEGQVLTYRGRAIFSAYHSNAGGATEEVDGAWPGSVRADFPYLSTVPSPYDTAARDLPGYEWCYEWNRTTTRAEIQQRIRSFGRDIGQVERVSVRGRTRSGRVNRLEIVGTRGRMVVRRPSEVSAVLGTPNGRLSLERRGNRYQMTGWGYGHGVGLSQQGALGMARAGFSYQEILGHYYTDIRLTEDYGRGASRALQGPELDSGETITLASFRDG